jgi:hypothetical protein
MRRIDVAVVRRIAIAAFALTAGGCGKHYLNQYDFSQKTLALVFIEPPQPELLHGWYNLDVGSNAVTAVVGAGAKVAKEMEARRASARLDSAAVGLDVTTKLAQRTLERVSRYLGTRIVSTPEGADYVLELNMRSFGIDARSNRTTSLYARAEAVVLDRRSGREIWSEDVRGTDRLTPYVIGTATVPSAVCDRNRHRAERHLHGGDAASGDRGRLPRGAGPADHVHVRHHHQRAARGSARRS